MKVRKKWPSTLVTLAMLASLMGPLAAPAAAGVYTSCTGASTCVEPGTGQEAGYAKAAVGPEEDVDSVYAAVTLPNREEYAENLAPAPVKAVMRIGDPIMFIDGEEFEMDIAPYIKDDRTMLPVRFAANAVGVPDNNILWDGINKQVTITKGDRVIQFTIGSNVMLINGAATVMDVAPEIIAGRTMLPVRYVGLALDADIKWDGTTQTVTIIAELERDDAAQTVTIPSGTSPAIEREFAWDYRGKHWTWRLAVPEEAYTYYTNLKRPPTDDYSVYVTDPADDAFISSLAARLKETAVWEKYSPKQTVEFVIAFVQNIKYVFDIISTGVEDYPRYPLETLVDQEGDCEDTSILLASILKEMGYEVVLIYFPGEHMAHMAVGVKGEDLPGTYYEYEGARYYYVESTYPGWSIGEIPDEYRQSEAYIFPLVPRPVISHKWTSKSTAGGWLELKVEVYNDGTATARATKVYAALDAGNGLVYDQRWSDPLDLEPHSTGFYTLSLKTPANVYTRLIVKIVSDGYLVDESTSDWVYTGF